MASWSSTSILYFSFVHVHRQKKLEDFAKDQENHITACTNLLRKLWTFRKDNIGNSDKVSNLGKIFQHLSKIEYFGSKYFGDNNHQVNGDNIMEINGSNVYTALSQLDQHSKTDDKEITKERYLNTCKR